MKLPSFELESKSAILENIVNELKVTHKTHLWSMQLFNMDVTRIFLKIKIPAQLLSCLLDCLSHHQDQGNFFEPYLEFAKKNITFARRAVVTLQILSLFNFQEGDAAHILCPAYGVT